MPFTIAFNVISATLNLSRCLLVVMSDGNGNHGHLFTEEQKVGGVYIMATNNYMGAAKVGARKQ